MDAVNVVQNENQGQAFASSSTSIDVSPTTGLLRSRVVGAERQQVSQTRALVSAGVFLVRKCCNHIHLDTRPLTPLAAKTECPRHYDCSKYYCIDCKIPICDECLAYHNGHQKTTIEAGIERVTNLSKFLILDIRKWMDICRAGVDRIQRMIDSIDNRGKTLISHVVLQARKLQSKNIFDHPTILPHIETQTEVFIQQVENVMKVKKELNSNQLINLQTHLNRLYLSESMLYTSQKNGLVVNMNIANQKALDALNSVRYLGENIQPLENGQMSIEDAHQGDPFTLFLGGKFKCSVPPPDKSYLLCAEPLKHQPTTLAHMIPQIGRPIYGHPERITLQYNTIPIKIELPQGTGNGEFNRPWGITTNRFGQIVIADRSNHRIQVLDMEGNFLFKFGTCGSGKGQFNLPVAVAISPYDDIVVADKENYRIQVFTKNGEFLHTFGEKGSGKGQFLFPWGVAVNSRCQIAVADPRNKRVQLFHWNGVYIKQWNRIGVKNIFDQPRGVAFSKDNLLVVSDFDLHQLVLIDLQTNAIRYIGGLGIEPNCFNRPSGIICDDNGWILVAEAQNRRIQVFNRQGTLMCKLGTEPKNKEDATTMLGSAVDIALTSTGHLVVMDAGLLPVRRRHFEAQNLNPLIPMSITIF